MEYSKKKDLLWDWMQRQFVEKQQSKFELDKMRCHCELTFIMFGSLQFACSEFIEENKLLRPLRSRTTIFDINPDAIDPSYCKKKESISKKQIGNQLHVQKKPKLNETKQKTKLQAKEEEIPECDNHALLPQFDAQKYSILESVESSKAPKFCDLMMLEIAEMEDVIERSSFDKIMRSKHKFTDVDIDACLKYLSDNNKLVYDNDCVYVI